MEELLYPTVAVVAFLLGRISMRVWRKKQKVRPDGTAAYQAFKEGK